jgi:hypothetical protein
MTRAEMIKKMMDKANELKKDYTWKGYAEIWEMCDEWNRTHEDEEILMYEHEDEETEMVDGFYIEYDYWVFD